MARVRPIDIVRQFRENGLKLLLHHPANARDVLTLAAPAQAAQCDFDHMVVDPTHYVASDYRHLCSDLVLRMPYHSRRGGRRRLLTIYILIEHQSEPDPYMIIRVEDYLVQILKGQLRARGEDPNSREEFRLQPVLPIVFYTGQRPWPSVTSLVDLIEDGRELAAYVPHFQPIFLNLSALSPNQLEAQGGAMGLVLGVLQGRHRSPQEFRSLLGHVTALLEDFSEEERGRWLLLLSYIQALVYHDRPGSERESLRQIIVDSVRDDPQRREIETMTRTIAEELRDEGKVEGVLLGTLKSHQQILIMQLRLRFGRVPRVMEQTIRATEDLERLRGWLTAFATAQTVEDIGIPTTRQS